VHLTGVCPTLPIGRRGRRADDRVSDSSVPLVQDGRLGVKRQMATVPVGNAAEVAQYPDREHAWLGAHGFAVLLVT
jgi:hypothetical protein